MNTIKNNFLKPSLLFIFHVSFIFSCFTQTFEEIRLQADSAKINEDWEEYAILYCEMGYAQWELEHFTQMKNYIDTAILIANQHQLDSLGDVFATIWNYYGFYYDGIGQYDKALWAFNKTLEIDTVLAKIDTSFNIENLGTNYQNIGTYLSKNGDYQKAADYYHYALRYLPNIDVNTATTLINIGLDFSKQKKYETAQRFFYKSIKALPPIKNNNTARTIKKLAYESLANNFYLESQQDSSLFFLKKVKQLIKPYEKNELSRYYSLLAQTNQLSNQFDKAQTNLQTALKLRLEKLSSKHPSVGLLYIKLGKLAIQKKEYPAALLHFQKALSSLVWEYQDSTNIASNPSLDDNISDKIKLLDVLSLKASTLKHLKKNKLSKSTYFLALELLDDLRIGYQSDQSKYVLLEKSLPIYEGAIQLAVEAEDKEATFQLIERSKATLLLENLKNIAAKKFANIPDALLERERDLKANIAFYERELAYNLRNDRSDAIQKNKQDLFILRQESQQLTSKLEQEYPSYYQLKYNRTFPSLAATQKQIATTNAAVLEYFVGDTTIYAFIITAQKNSMLVLPKKKDFDLQIKALTQVMSMATTGEKAFLTFTTAASNIFTNYFQPLLQEVPTTTTQLTIIPDGQLGYIPFQSLIQYPVMASAYKEARYDTLSFVVKRYAIHYAYSAALAVNKNTINRAATTSVFGGFAPVFDNQSVASKRGGSLGKLQYSLAEVQALEQLLTGKIFLETAATVHIFSKEAKQFKILHLATHAAADEDPIHTKIHFIDDYLTVKDIYNLPINADLVVLSACETGIGKLQRGEGIISLERAFMYAGCPSMLTSLWQVDDKETSNLMVDFYKNLKDGQDKDDALQQAQIHYLKNISSAEAAHPFYWAAFILTGTKQAIFEPSARCLMYALGALSSLIVLFISWRYAKKKRIN